MDFEKVIIASNFMHSASYLRDLEPWYLVGLKDQEKDKKVSTEYQKSYFFKEKKKELLM